jgi:hypothetical protein
LVSQLGVREPNAVLHLVQKLKRMAEATRRKIGDYQAKGQLLDAQAYLKRLSSELDTLRGNQESLLSATMRSALAQFALLLYSTATMPVVNDERFFELATAHCSNFDDLVEQIEIFAT